MYSCPEFRIARFPGIQTPCRIVFTFSGLDVPHLLFHLEGYFLHRWILVGLCQPFQAGLEGTYPGPCQTVPAAGFYRLFCGHGSISLPGQTAPEYVSCDTWPGYIDFPGIPQSFNVEHGGEPAMINLFAVYVSTVPGNKAAA